MAYAAKFFYNIGIPNHTVTPDENSNHLREELIRQKLASNALQKFSSCVKTHNISSFGEYSTFIGCKPDDIFEKDLRVANSFLCYVSGGPEKGRAWLVDPLLSNTKMHKFSGTVEAGANHDLVGQTCDAFAHFSLDDSGGHLVFVDIQGKM
jgi:hypothetical protein